MWVGTTHCGRKGEGGVQSDRRIAWYIHSSCNTYVGNEILAAKAPGSPDSHKSNTDLNLYGTDAAPGLLWTWGTLGKSYIFTLKSDLLRHRASILVGIPPPLFVLHEATDLSKWLHWSAKMLELQGEALRQSLKWLPGNANRERADSAASRRWQSQLIGIL